MSKKRVYEIARERGLETRQVMRRLQQAGVEVKAAASTVSDADIERVFGTRQEPVTPSATGALPSWLSAGTAGPRTTTKAEIDAKKEAATKKVDAAKNAKAKAVEQAKRLRQQMAEKQRAAAEASAESAAAAPPTPVAPPVEAAPVAEAPAVAEPLSDAQVEVAIDEAAETVAPVVAEPEVEEAAVGHIAEPSDDGVAEAPEGTVTPNGAAPAAPVEAEPAVAEPEETVPLTEAEARKRAQQLAATRVADQAARRRAQLEAEKVEVAQRAKDAEKAEKKKDKKKKPGEEGAAPKEEFVGSRKPRVGGPSRDSEAGGRRGPSRKRRVVIDAGANRRPGGGDQRGRGRGRGGSRGRVAEAVVIDPTIPVTIHAGATVKDLGDSLGVGSTEVIKVLMQGGDFVTITQSLTQEQIELVGIGLDPPREIIVKSAADEEIIPVFEDRDEDMVTRAPVVTIMGHVDHGKTSLLDAIRSTKVTEGEAGGITQHIGAYQVTMPDGRSVTFLDTPGHEAFTALRARGAKVTDEAVLVVAADDGVKPQTLEAIDHARAAGVPIVVAINKIDKDNAQPDRVKSELATHDLQPEEWGGKTVMVEVSAKQRQNLDELIEMILLQSDVLELKANPNAEASGYIIESKLDPGRGPVCTMLIARGTLKVGDIVLAGQTYGKVRALNDFTGKRVKEAPPSMPVEIVGFNDVPDAGEFCQVVESEREARDRAQKMSQRLRAETLAKRQRGLSLEDLFNRIKEGQIQDLNLILKADVAGSIEAIEQELGKIEHPEVKVRIIHTGVGGITGSDVNLAVASSAIVMGFNVRPNAEAKTTAEKEGVDVRSYNVIYKLREDVENALSGMLSPEQVEETLGEAEVRQVFKASRIGTIAGSFVTQGKIERNNRVRLLRDGTIIHDGTLASLKRFKDDVKEVAQGFECGLAIENYNDVKEGDVIEAYTVKQVERDITSELAGSASA